MESIDDATGLLLSLSSGSDAENIPNNKQNTRKRRLRASDGDFECKTCNRRFSSFQALGGHCTGHKRAKILNLKDILERSDIYDVDRHSLQKSPRKNLLHQCTICGEGFSMGQALGGHMRRHRADPIEVHDTSGFNMPLPSLEECGQSDDISAFPRNTSHIRLLELFV